MKKRILLSVITLFVVVAAMGESVTRQAARQKAMRILGTQDAMQLVACGQGEEPAYYVFNAARVGGGFAIISGDDRLPEVLGYAETGRFDTRELPDNLRWWLECYEEQVRMVREGSASAASPVKHDPIPALIETHWDQSEPYNLQLPSYGSARCYTGCVATAMAQLMKYWAIETPSTAIPAYTTQYLGIAMPALPEATFNYEAMKNDYNGTETDESADAVAQLMLYCGQSVEMDYTPIASSAAHSAAAFVNYFGFDGAARNISRSEYSAVEWDGLIHGELAARRPVLYGGHSATTGHEFLCDGCDDAGYYHINWGWGGYMDGYYLLSLCNPYDKGAGGGSGNDGYTMLQDVLIGLQPDQGNPVVTDLAITVDAISAGAASLTRTRSADDFKLPVRAALWNMTEAGGTFNLGFLLYQGDKQVAVCWDGNSTYNIGSHLGSYGIDFTVKVGGGLADGTYVLRPAFRLKGTTEWQNDNGSHQYYLELHIAGNTMTVVEPAEMENITLNSITTSGKMKAGLPVDIVLNFTNKGSVYVENYMIIAKDGDATETPIELDLETEAPDAAMAIALDPGESGDFRFYYIPNTSGKKTVFIVSELKGVVAQTVLDIKERQNMNITASNFRVPEADRKNVVPENTIRVTFDVTNNGTEVADDYLDCSLWRHTTGNSGIYAGQQSVDIQLEPGETKSYEVEFDGLLYDTKYFVQFDQYIPSTETVRTLKQVGWITTGEAPVSGIEAPQAAADDAMAPVYNLHGQRVGTLGDLQGMPVGIYMVKGKKIVKK